MAFLRNVFLKNNDGTETPTSEPSGAAYVAWKAGNYDDASRSRINKRYAMGHFTRYYKILKKESKSPIS